MVLCIRFALSLHYMEMNELKIDVDAVLRAKLPRHYKYIPHFLVSWLKRTVCQDKLNDILMRNSQKRGVDFAKAMMREFDINIEVRGEENIPETDRCIFVCNHPLGGLDGMALIATLGDRFSGNIKFVVNDLLMAVKPFSDIFIPINKHGRQSRVGASLFENAMQSEAQIITFPAGLCSRNTHGNVIEDLDWKKNFIVNAVKYHRNVVPIYFDGTNSGFFYRFSKIRMALGLKFNIEMIYLPSEMFKSKGKTFTITVGKPIDWKSFDNSRKPVQWAADVRSRVYKLSNT